MGDIMTVNTISFNIHVNPPMAFKSGTDPPKTQKRRYLVFDRVFFIIYTLDVSNNDE